MSARSPAAAATAAGPLRARRRRRALRELLAGKVAPYALLLPAMAVVGAVLGYPIYFLVRLSFERYGLPELIQHKGVWIGLENFSRILHDSEFWTVLGRTVLFTVANVGLTMLFGTVIALLLVRLGGFMRLLLTSGLILVWATPVIVAVTIWRWMVDFEFGVFNWLLTELHVGDYVHHDWFENPWTGFAVITAVVVWGAIPFVAITIFAGLSQVPQDLVEAASIDGASSWQVFRDLTFPLLKPIFVILTSLSIIWDFQVFNQVWIMRDARPTPDYYLMSIYSFVESFGVSNYGYGSAIAVVMVFVMFLVSFVYIRQMVKIGELR